MNLALIPGTRVPILISAAGERARTRFWQFFDCIIRNPHMRRTYDRAVLNQYGLASCPIGPSRSTNKDCYF